MYKKSTRSLVMIFFARLYSWKKARNPMSPISLGLVNGKAFTFSIRKYSGNRLNRAGSAFSS